MLPTRPFAIGLKRRTAVVSLMLLLAAATGDSQQRIQPPRIPEGTSAIRGRFIDRLTKEPVAGCPLRILASGHVEQRVTDQAGAFELKDISAGVYALITDCPAHQPCFFNGVEPTLTRCQVEVFRDQEKTVEFELTPGAIARGQVMTFDGRPVTRAMVRLGRGMRGEPAAIGKPVMTDTEGRFELLNLQPGEWRLEVEIPAEPGGLRPPIVYYPGGLSWEEAGGVELEAGRSKDNLTITVPRINENVLTVVVPPADATISDVVVSVLQQSPLVTRRVALNAEGVGTLKGVLPGRYFAVALASSGKQRWAGFEIVDFIEDSYEARLQLLPTGGIAGRIVVERGTLALDGLMIGASWVHQGEEVNPLELAEARAAADGSFRIDHLYGTRMLQVRGLGPDWEVAAVRQDRTDVTISGVAIVPDETVEATIVLRRR